MVTGSKTGAGTTLVALFDMFDGLQLMFDIVAPRPTTPGSGAECDGKN
jgi:hypothetical protein